jgi:hypothetical protein
MNFRSRCQHAVRRAAAVLALATVVAGGTGCASEEIVRARLDVTVGQQLIELKRAHDAGALSRAEYDRQRQQLIDSVR